MLCLSVVVLQLCFWRERMIVRQYNWADLVLIKSFSFNDQFIDVNSFEFEKKGLPLSFFDTSASSFDETSELLWFNIPVFLKHLFFLVAELTNDVISFEFEMKVLPSSLLTKTPAQKVFFWRNKVIKTFSADVLFSIKLPQIFGFFNENFRRVLVTAITCKKDQKMIAFWFFTRLGLKEYTL